MCRGNVGMEMEGEVHSLCCNTDRSPTPLDSEIPVIDNFHTCGQLSPLRIKSQRGPVPCFPNLLSPLRLPRNLFWEWSGLDSDEGLSIDSSDSGAFLLWSLNERRLKAPVVKPKLEEWWELEADGQLPIPLWPLLGVCRTLPARWLECT